MGCDIHLYREKKINGQWLTADEWVTADDDDPRYQEIANHAYTDRNYTLFGFLANVRRDVPGGFGDPRGLPSDVSSEVKADSDYWDCDGHDHSWLTISEIKEKLTECLIQQPEYFDRYQAALHIIVRSFDDVDGDEHRIVFWFDN